MSQLNNINQNQKNSQAVRQIQAQVEAVKLEATREILKHYQVIKVQSLIKSKTGSRAKSAQTSSTIQTTSSTNLETNQPKISKQEEQLMTKLWKLWIDQTQENKLKSELLTNLITEIKSKANDLVLALRTSNTNPNSQTILQFLVENKLAKINGYVEVTDQQIFYTNPAGQSIPVGNLELTEIEFEKQKIYTHYFKSVNKVGQITLAELEALPKMDQQITGYLLLELVGKIGTGA